MSIKTAYIAKLGANYPLSDHFTLGEMQCKDGSDKVLYSTDLLDKLEKLRSYGGFTIMINSGYRTAAHNKEVKGATKSQHLYGTAMDIVVNNQTAHWLSFLYDEGLGVDAIDAGSWDFIFKSKVSRKEGLIYWTLNFY